MTYRKIVVGTDGSPTAAEAVRRAAELAETFSCPLHVVSAYRATIAGMEMFPEASLAVSDWIMAVEADTEAMLSTLADGLRARGIKVVTHMVCGHPATAILNVAAAEGADLVVVGNKGMHGAKRVLGSVPNSVSHHAGCDVLIVHTT